MPNRLTEETSPYLRQHADNPVDWYPWGEEALERARREDRPILLSIGYSSCHWCHVMEEESFEDEETARLMNDAFVNVKVDREERPDVDAVYITAVQGMTGRGGWPLTVFLTPEGEPFYGGTYFPPEPRLGMPSFREVLRSVASAWEERREDVEESAGRLRRFLERSVEPGDGPDPDAPGEELLDRAYRGLESRYDDRRGGFGEAPKFPRALALELLLRDHARTGRERALEMVVGTLDAMARGGIRDHLAGGFHRYAVDERWLVPHFEKMLYDNALLTRVYAQAWRASGEKRLAGVARETGEYMLADLRSPEGGFYSARDADSGGEEGRYYVWTPEEVRSVLGADAARLVERRYGVTPEGNFEGKSVLHIARDLPAATRGRLATAREELLEARRRREAPFRDEKVLASWNGLAVRALAEAGFALGRDDWLDAAGDSAGFLVDALRPDDRLLHVWKDGEARVDAFLEDHAALGNALLSLWEVSGRDRWLEEAVRLGEEALEGFWDEGSGVFYDAPAGGAGLPVRPRDDSDRATPSGTALAADLLLRLARITGDDRWRPPAERALAGAAERAARQPLAFGRLLGVLDLHLSPPGEIVVVGDRGSEAMEGLLDVIRERWLPNRVLAVAGPPGEGEPRPEARSPLLRGRSPVDGHATAFVCREYACREPVVEPGALARQLDDGPGA